MSIHHTQSGRKNQIDKVRDLILEHGGLNEITEHLGMTHFKSIVAYELNCTERKAVEYIQLCKRYAIAKSLTAKEVRVIGEEEVT